MISTRHLKGLPDIDPLSRLCQSLAMLDAILEPEWEYRYYSFNSRWGRGKMMSSMRNGSGDDWFILFNKHGAAMKGFAHECPMADVDKLPWPGVLDSVPRPFVSFLNEPAFSMMETTFCIWRQYGDAGWKVGKIEFPPGDDPDGSARLLAMLDGRPKTYQAWGQDYYDRKIPLKWVSAVYHHTPLSEDLMRGLNSDRSLLDLSEDIKEIGYPVLTSPK